MELVNQQIPHTVTLSTTRFISATIDVAPHVRMVFSSDTLPTAVVPYRFSILIKYVTMMIPC